MNTDQKIIKNKVGLLNLAEMLGSVSEGTVTLPSLRDPGRRMTTIQVDILRTARTFSGRSRHVSNFVPDLKAFISFASIPGCVQ